MRGVQVCVFSALDDVPKKLRGDARTVLAVLARAKRFSEFEVDGPLGAALEDLIRRKLITTDHERHGYPWTAVDLTDAGRAMLAKERGT